MPSVRELAEQLWSGETTTSEIHPVGTWFPEGEELADAVLYYKGLAGSTTVDSGDGLVMLDTGSKQDTQKLHATVRGWRAEAPLRAAVFSHHHVDHIFGVGPFEHEARERGWGAPLVYGHELLGPNFDRYRKTQGWNTAINVRQFALPMDRFRWPEDYRYPDVTYSRRMTVTCGGADAGASPRARRNGGRNVDLDPGEAAAGPG